MQKLSIRQYAAILLIFGQMCSVVHAAEFGHEAHAHEGILCVALVSDDEQDLYIPSAASKYYSDASWQLRKTGMPVTPGLPKACVVPPKTGPPT